MHPPGGGKRTAMPFSNASVEFLNSDVKIISNLHITDISRSSTKVLQDFAFLRQCKAFQLEEGNVQEQYKIVAGHRRESE